MRDMASYLEVPTPYMQQSFEHWLAVFEKQFGRVTPTERMMFEMAYKTGYSNGATLDMDNTPTRAALAEIDAFARHQVATAKAEEE